MDLDVMGKHIHSLLAFKGELEKMMEGSGGNVEKATDQLDQLMQFKSTVEASMPDIGKMVQDISTVVDDIAKVKTDLAPVLEWIAAKQKAEEDLKAARAETDKALAKAAAEKPPEPPAATADEPLEHIAEVEASIGDAQPAERSESEHTPG
jgi:ABC-type transporter Mla subunit MlaD